MKIARLIITFDCVRNCSYCCNKMSTVKTWWKPCDDLSHLYDYDQVIITGGEPFMYPDRALAIIDDLRQNARPDQKIFIYSTIPMIPQLEEIISRVDGMHVTLHEDSTQAGVVFMEQFQAVIAKYPDKSFRLYIFPNLRYSFNLIPYHWSRVEVKPWLTVEEMELPKNEELLYLTDKRFSEIR